MIGRPALASLLAVLAGGCLDVATDDGHVTEQLAFGRSAFATRQACQEAKERGDFPWLAACQDQILLCPDGRAATLISGDVIERPSYRVDDDTLTLAWSTDYRTTGTLAPDGTLVTNDSPRPWQPIVIVDGIGWELGTCAAAWSP